MLRRFALTTTLLALYLREENGALGFYRGVPIFSVTEDFAYGLTILWPGHPEATSCNPFGDALQPRPPAVEAQMQAMVFRTLLPGANTYSLYGLFEYGDYAEAAELALNIARRSPESTRDTAYLAAVALEFAGDADAAALQYAALAADDAAFPYNLLAAIHLKD